MEDLFLFGGGAFGGEVKQAMKHDVFLETMK